MDEITADSIELEDQRFRDSALGNCVEVTQGRSQTQRLKKRVGEVDG